MEVYKYMPEARKDFFSSFRLRFTQPQALNDPYECLPANSDTDYDILLDQAIERMGSDELRKIGPDLAGAKKNLKSEYERTGKPERIFIETYKRELNNRIGILSLSKRNDSALMWSHYTNSHKGFVVGFDPNHHFFKKQDTDDTDIGDLREVQYSQDRPTISIPDMNLTTKHLECKNIEWAYEKELRLIRNLKNASHVKNDQEPKIFLFDIPKECISSVIFGIDCLPELQQEIENIVRKDKALETVKLYKAQMDRKSYIIQTHELAQLKSII